MSILGMFISSLFCILLELSQFSHLLLHHCLCHHIVLLSPLFLQRPICVPFCELFPMWLSLLPEHSHSFLFKAVWTQGARKLNFFAFPSQIELCNTTFLFCFLFQKTYLTLLIKIRLFREIFTDRRGLFQYVS